MNIENTMLSDVDVENNLDDKGNFMIRWRDTRGTGEREAVPLESLPHGEDFRALVRWACEKYGCSPEHAKRVVGSIFEETPTPPPGGERNSKKFR